MHPVRIGTCGWSYEDCHGVFYPDDVPSGEFLGYYAERYPVVEVRNKAWLNAKLLDCLRNHQAVCCLVDQAWMPPPLRVLDQLDVVTGAFAYVRLLGDRAEVDKKTSTLDHTVIDRGDQITADA